MKKTTEAFLKELKEKGVIIAYCCTKTTKSRNKKGHSYTAC